MAQCVVIDGTTGAVSATTADPCTTLLLLTPVEYGAITQTPWSVISDPADAALLASAMLSVWAVAWAFRALRLALNTDGEPLYEEGS
jgi:hypothetical protein